MKATAHCKCLILLLAAACSGSSSSGKTTDASAANTPWSAADASAANTPLPAADAKGAETYPSAPLAQAEIGPSGGSVQSADGVRIVVPAGALSQKTTLTITRVPDRAGPPGSRQLGPIFQLGPEGTTFAKPVQVTLPWSTTKIPAGEGLPRVYRASHGGNDWTATEGVIGADSVTAPTTGLSDWGVFWWAPNTGGPSVPAGDWTVMPGPLAGCPADVGGILVGYDSFVTTASHVTIDANEGLCELNFTGSSKWTLVGNPMCVFGSELGPANVTFTSGEIVADSLGRISVDLKGTLEVKGHNCTFSFGGTGTPRKP
jgi:hypothetical protein